jgi:E3 ubiquitin-protein ligase HECTD1
MYYDFSVLVKREKDCSSKDKDASGGSVVVSNPMSVSVPNLTSASGTNTMETSATAGLLETFAAMARRRTLGAVTGGGGGGSSGASGTGSGTGNAGGGGAGNIPSPSCTTPSPSPSPGSSLFPRGPSSVSSLVRLALSSNFPG